MRHLVEVGVGEDGELLLDGLEQPDGDVEAGVGAVRELRGALHGAERAAGLGGHVEGPGRVPPADDRSDQIALGREEREGGSRRSYARRSMRGAQFFSAMKPRSLRLALATAARYSSLTVG